MRTVITTVLALIGGLFAGIVVSEIIGIIGFLLFDSIVGFRLLPVISAVVAAAAVIVNARVRRRSAAPSPQPTKSTDHEAVRHDHGS